MNVSSRHGIELAGIDVDLCLFCQRFLVDCRSVPKSDQSHRVPDVRWPSRIHSHLGLEVPDTYPLDDQPLQTAYTHAAYG